MESGTEIANNFLNSMTDELYVMNPCKVVGVHGNYVDVLLYINDEEPDVTIYNVPIIRQETQRAYIFLGIKEGDRGTCRFFDRSTEAYLQSDFDYNSDDRQHDINDRAFELGFIPDKEAYAYPVQDTVVNVDNLIPDFNSDDFNTPLTEAEELEYQEWFASMQTQGYIVDGDTGYDYDFRGAFKAGFQPSSVGGHWVDTWKKPNHETFSNESIYATGDYKQYAGNWDGDNYIAPSSRIMPNPEIEIGLKSGVCKITIKADGTLAINSTTKIEITGNVTITGDLTVSGEVKGNSIPLSTHKHIGVTTGDGTSGTPTT